MAVTARTLETADEDGRADDEVVVVTSIVAVTEAGVVDTETGWNGELVTLITRPLDVVGVVVVVVVVAEDDVLEVLDGVSRVFVVVVSFVAVKVVAGAEREESPDEAEEGFGSEAEALEAAEAPLVAAAEDTASVELELELAAEESEPLLEEGAAELDAPLGLFLFWMRSMIRFEIRGSVNCVVRLAWSTK